MNIALIIGGGPVGLTCRAYAPPPSRGSCSILRWRQRYLAHLQPQGQPHRSGCARAASYSADNCSTIRSRLTPDTLMKLGALPTMRIGLSYLRSRLAPISPETTLEEFFINRFGRELYATFFRDYTEKVWGMPCSAISAAPGRPCAESLSRLLRNLRPLDVIRQCVDRFDNLVLLDRNGMHRYNNQDHSMLSAMVAVENIVAGRTDKAISSRSAPKPTITKKNSSARRPRRASPRA